MSIQYYFYNRSISKKDILEQTDLKIEHHNGSDWIISSDESNLRIVEVNLMNKETGEHYVNKERVFELENHGFKDVKYILDTLVTKFNLLFYTDNEFEEYLHDRDFDMKLGVREAMKEHGNYKIIDYKKGIVEICEGEVTYPSDFKEPFTELDQIITKLNKEYGD